jgi:hypothetical protein
MKDTYQCPYSDQQGDGISKFISKESMVNHQAIHFRINLPIHIIISNPPQLATLREILSNLDMVSTKHL